jgi:hypothetical protein
MNVITIDKITEIAIVFFSNSAAFEKRDEKAFYYW